MNNVVEPRWQITEASPQAETVEVVPSKSTLTKKIKKTPSAVYVHANYDKMCRDEQDFDKCCNYVMYLGGKIVRRGYQVELNEFLNLVNVNGFYKGVQPSSSSGSTSSSAVGAVVEDSGSRKK